MTEMNRLPLTVLMAAVALLSACGPAEDPNANKVPSACLALGASDASAILGVQVMPNKLTGDDAPMSVCAYKDDKDNSIGLAQIKSNKKIADPAADLAGDRDEITGLQKVAVKPGKIHDAQGFGPGAFFLDQYTGPSTISVELHVNQNGYKVMAQVNNPANFASGEGTAGAMVQKIFVNIQNGSGLTSL
jgi:hypothetical protein